jgi:hypothetical protein
MKIEKNKTIITTFVYHLKRNKMLTEFVPYQIAVDMKSIGFNEPCFGLYHNDKTLSPTQCKSHEQFYGQVCSAPLYQQALRHFREKHDLDSFVKHLYKSTIKVGYYFGIDEYKGVKFQMDFDIWYNTYEEAELECLKKLIEIVKNK